MKNVRYATFEEFDMMTDQIAGTELSRFGFSAGHAIGRKLNCTKVYRAVDQQITFTYDRDGLFTLYRSNRCASVAPELLLKLLGRKFDWPRLEGEYALEGPLKRFVRLFTHDLRDVLDGTLDFVVTDADLKARMDTWHRLAERLLKDFSKALALKGYNLESTEPKNAIWGRTTETGSVSVRLEFEFRHYALGIFTHIHIRNDELERFVEDHFHDGKGIVRQGDTVIVPMYELEGDWLKGLHIEAEGEYETVRDSVINEYFRLGEPFTQTMDQLPEMYRFLLDHRRPWEPSGRSRPEIDDAKAIYVACQMGRFREARIILDRVRSMLDQQLSAPDPGQVWANWNSKFERFIGALSVRFPIGPLH